MFFSDFDLTQFNTFRLCAVSESLLVLESQKQFIYLYELFINSKIEYYFLLGGGSNVVLPREFPGLIILNQLYGIKIVDSTTEYLLLDVASGENWDKLVRFSITQKVGGLENLSGIPGTVGGAVVQNIGAYGVEISQYIVSVTLFDMYTGVIINFLYHECNFSYRSSIFKNNKRYIVVSVCIKLFYNHPCNLSYLNIYGIYDRELVREKILQERANKLPNINYYGSVGSFFCNPIITNQQCSKLLSKYPLLLHHNYNNMIKLSSGWILEHLEFKGYHYTKSLAMYHKHALVMINYGFCLQYEVLEFAKYIMKTVYNNFALKLIIEPVILKPDWRGSEDFFNE